MEIYRRCRVCCRLLTGILTNQRLPRRNGRTEARARHAHEYLPPRAKEDLGRVRGIRRDVLPSDVQIGKVHARHRRPAVPHWRREPLLQGHRGRVALFAHDTIKFGGGEHHAEVRGPESRGDHAGVDERAERRRAIPAHLRRHT